MVFWSALISGYGQHGYGHAALKCFDDMQIHGILPDAVTFTCVLKACASICSLKIEECIHRDIKKSGLLRNDVILGNSLDDMYAKCGQSDKAQKVFEMLPSLDILSMEMVKKHLNASM